MKVILDTSVLVSALLNPHGYPAKLLALWVQDKFEVIISPQIIEELRKTLTAPRLTRKYHLTTIEIERYIELILLRTTTVYPTGKIRLCRDQRDNHILEAALIGKAEAVISRDDDLKRDLRLMKVMEGFAVRMLTVNNFLKMFGKQG